MAKNAIALLGISVGNQVKLYSVVSFSSWTKLPTSPLMISKVKLLVSVTEISNEDCWPIVAMKVAGPVILGGLLAVYMWKEYIL